jgi:hypothetical protein
LATDGSDGARTSGVTGAAKLHRLRALPREFSS